mmetsp:Transcript_33114/g.95893  ORF Transcript_33114/g.95893 Transcript_33114/m.95893 type:complete len:384 (+) Transcript_33114:408-1559(+)
MRPAHCYGEIFWRHWWPSSAFLARSQLRSGSRTPCGHLLSPGLSSSCSALDYTCLSRRRPSHRSQLTSLKCAPSSGRAKKSTKKMRRRWRPLSVLRSISDSSSSSSTARARLQWKVFTCTFKEKLGRLRHWLPWPVKCGRSWTSRVSMLWAPQTAEEMEWRRHLPLRWSWHKQWSFCASSFAPFSRLPQSLATSTISTVPPARAASLSRVLLSQHGAVFGPFHQRVQCSGRRFWARSRSGLLLPWPWSRKNGSCARLLTRCTTCGPTTPLFALWSWCPCPGSTPSCTPRSPQCQIPSAQLSASFVGRFSLPTARDSALSMLRPAMLAWEPSFCSRSAPSSLFMGPGHATLLLRTWTPTANATATSEVDLSTQIHCESTSSETL